MSPELQKSVQHFISLKFSDLMEIRDSDSRYWVYKKDTNPFKPMIEYDNEENLWVSKSLWNEIQKMFNIRYNQIQSSIKLWAQAEWELEEPLPKRDDF